MKQYTLLGIQTPLWILVILHIITFCTAFWYAPNDWCPWWTVGYVDGHGKVYQISETAYDMGEYILIVEKEGYVYN